MSLSDEQWKFLQDIARLVPYAEINGFKMTGGELERSQSVQDIYFKEGKSKKRFSNHQKKLAQDFNIFFKNDKDKWELVSRKTLYKLKILGKFWEDLDEKNRWGGNWKKLPYDEEWEAYINDPKNFIDAPHWERQV